MTMMMTKKMLLNITWMTILTRRNLRRAKKPQKRVPRTIRPERNEDPHLPHLQAQVHLQNLQAPVRATRDENLDPEASPDRGLEEAEAEIRRRRTLATHHLLRRRLVAVAVGLDRRHLRGGNRDHLPGTVTAKAGGKDLGRGFLCLLVRSMQSSKLAVTKSIGFVGYAVCFFTGYQSLWVWLNLDLLHKRRRCPADDLQQNFENDSLVVFTT